MNRRDFLKFALGTASATFIDYEQLLWIPGEKTIFLPPEKVITIVHYGTGVIEADIVAAELEKMMHKVRFLFERDETFYKVITKRGIHISEDEI